MKYFFLAFIGAIVLTIGIFGFRGDKTTNTPIEIFPDMDRMDFVKGQKPSDFFHDGMGARLPVSGTVPHASDDGVFPVEFGEGRTGHYFTGAINDYFARGLPLEELGLIGDGAVGEMQALCKAVELEVDCTGLSPSAMADRVIQAGKALPTVWDSFSA